MRFLPKGILIIASLLALSGGYLIWRNNHSVAPPSHAKIATALENSINWLVDHRQQALNTANPMLWYIVQKAGDISGDARLIALFADYERRHLGNNPNNIWRPLFYPNSWVPVHLEELTHFPYYNWYFIYASTCDRDLAKVPEIEAQNEPSFCDQHLLAPACVTHQMMGLLLMKRSRCGDQGQLENTIETLQLRIRTQLIWDPRVVDVYIQRVLMLVASGAGDAVKPVWLQKIVDAQLPDGGWSPFMPLVSVGGGRSIGTRRLISIETPKSDFHITAQGILLFALLSNQQPLTAPEHRTPSRPDKKAGSEVGGNSLARYKTGTGMLPAYDTPKTSALQED